MTIGMQELKCLPVGFTMIFGIHFYNHNSPSALFVGNSFKELV
jgi:hypothetical protein